MTTADLLQILLVEDSLPDIELTLEALEEALHGLDVPTLLIIGVALAAAWIPARVAARVSPLEAFRN